MSSCSDEEYFYKLDNMVLRSNEFLRHVFKWRWNIECGEDWQDEPNYIQKFISQHSEHILKKAIPLQRKILLDSCSLEDWDLSLMSLVLLNFGNENTYKIPNQAIRQLKNLRNDLAHHKSKRLTQSEYCEKLKIFKGILNILKVDECEIGKLIEESNVSSSSEDNIRLNSLLQNAEQLSKSKKFEVALSKYSEALKFPRLSSINIGEIYEKRAACHLKMKDSPTIYEKHIDQATLDVEQALQLNKYSWNAHYLKAQCLKAKNSLPEAICYYEMALAMSPAQKKVKQDLDSCKLEYSTQNINANLNLDQLPISVSEIAEMNKTDNGRIYTLKEIAELGGFEKCPLYLGEKYYHGYEVPQNYEKAIKYFTKADKQGFAEGTSKVGLCYYRGHGVKQDVEKAVEIFKRCAKMDAKMKNSFQPLTPLGFNNGVSSAENLIGVCYENGTGVEKNLVEASIWYNRAMEHGSGAAATNLGLLYYNRHGFKKNEKMAMMCWKQGLNLGCTSAVVSLVQYYWQHMEPEMAWIMFNMGKEIGNSQFLKMSDEYFNRNLTMVQSQRCRLENRVTAFEAEHNLDTQGMTFKERSTRTELNLNKNYADLLTPNKFKSWGGEIQNIDQFVMMTIDLKRCVSKTAQEVYTAVERNYDLNVLLDTNDELSKTCQLKAVHLFYEFLVLEDHLTRYVINVKKLKSIVADLFYENCQQTNENEMKIRYCFLGYNLSQSLDTPDEIYAFGILKEGIRRYPDNYEYHHLFIQTLMGRSSYKNAIKYVNDTLEKFPNKVDLQFLKAHILLYSKTVESSEIIKVLKVFLDNAPRDHRHVPEAYYVISFAHMEDHMNHDQAKGPGYRNDEKVKLVEENFKCGKEAENDQLPCYKPYGLSYFQSIVKGFLAEMAEKSQLNAKLNDISKAVAPTCEQSNGVLERKYYLNSPVRKGLVLQHRERLRDSVGLNRIDLPFDDKVVQVKVRQKRVTKMAKLKSITLQEMNPTKDKIYENRILDLTIIEEPNLYSNSVQLIAEDDNWDTARVYIDSFAVGNISVGRFAAGSRIAIINPYMGICAETKVNGIRVNEQKCLVNLEKVKDMCRFCGEENATRKCSKCKRMYCSRECQKLDWQVFEHKLICSIDPEITSRINTIEIFKK